MYALYEVRQLYYLCDVIQNKNRHDDGSEDGSAVDDNSHCSDNHGHVHNPPASVHWDAHVDLERGKVKCQQTKEIVKKSLLWYTRWNTDRRHVGCMCQVGRILYYTAMGLLPDT